MANKNGKPTNKQRDEAIGELFSNVKTLNDMLRQLDVIIGMYIQYNDKDKKGHKEGFDKFVIEIQEKLKKEQDDAEANGDADKPNLQGDTDGESSGTEGIREKE